MIKYLIPLLLLSGCSTYFISHQGGYRGLFGSKTAKEAYIATHQSLDEDIKYGILNHMLVTGMTVGDVETMFQETPFRKSYTMTAFGESEMYEIGSTRTWYLFFQDGKLTSWSTR